MNEIDEEFVSIGVGTATCPECETEIIWTRTEDGWEWRSLHAVTCPSLYRKVRAS